MTLEEFLVDVERQEAVGVVAGNGECRLGEVVGTEGSEAIDGVNVIVIAGDFGAQGGNDFAAGNGGCRGLDHRAECVRNCEAHLSSRYEFALRGIHVLGTSFVADGQFVILVAVYDDIVWVFISTLICVIICKLGPVCAR